MTPNNAQNTQHKLGVVFSYLERNNITATLCNKGGFFLDCICVDTQLPYFDALTHMVIHVSAAFFFNICRRKAYISICACQRLLDLPKRSIPWVKFYFGLSLHIFSMVRHCLWKCVRLLLHASMKQGCLARRPLCHKVNLPSCVAGRALCHTILTEFSV